MRLILVRHGETLENVEGICQGQNHGQLSEKGILQAKRLGLRFKDEKIDIVFSSDLKRAVDTARQVLRYHPHLELNLDRRVRERYVGDFQGKRVPEGFDWENPQAEVETRADMCERAKEFIEDIYKDNPDKTVLVVCHGGIKKALLTVIYKRPVSFWGIGEEIKNTSVSEFDIEEEGDIQVYALNCIKHLD